MLSNYYLLIVVINIPSSQKFQAFLCTINQYRSAAICFESFNLTHPTSHKHYRVTYEIFSKRKVLIISPPTLIGSTFIMLIFCPILKIAYSDLNRIGIFTINIFCNTKVAGLGEFLSSEIFTYTVFCWPCLLTVAMYCLLVH